MSSRGGGRGGRGGGRGRGGNRGGSRGGRNNSGQAGQHRGDIKANGLVQRVKNNNNNNNNNKANNKKQQQNDRKHHTDKQTDGFKFVVTGFQAETSAQELVAFVTSSAAVKLNLVETGFNADGSFYLVVDTTRESAAIAKLSSRQFNGSRLTIKQVFNPHASNKLVQLLSSYVEANYDASFGYLDLSALKRGIPSVPIDLNNSNTTKTLFAVIKEKCPDVQTLNLASNRIHSLYALAHLRQSAPNVINLSLEDNNVSDFRQLDHLKALPLRELMLRNNPIAVDAVAYRTAVSTRVPRLKILDTQEIAPLIQFNVPRDADAFAMPELRASYADSDAFFAYDFVRRFLAFYDTGQRAQLDHLYAENSLFSLTTTLQPSIVRERPRRGAASTTVPTDTAGIYIGASRNLATSGAASSSDAAHASTSSSSARDRVQRGRINILHQLLQLPASTHDVDTLVIDAYVVREALVLVSVHGFFLENDSGEVHSFSRTFTLTPAPADSGAMLQGWPVIVLNDQLCVRPAPQRRHFTPVAAAATAGAAMTVLPTTQVALGPAVSQSFGMQLPQSLTFGRPFAAAAAAATTAASTTLSPDALQRLVYVTSLKPQFAQQILDATGWNYEAALQQFVNLKKTKQLPPDALSSH